MWYIKDQPSFDCCESLLCPVCNTNNMHMSGFSEGATPDLYKDDTLEISFWGECGHQAILSVYTHKGCTYMRWHSAEDMPREDEGPEPPESNDEPPTSEESLAGWKPKKP